MEEKNKPDVCILMASFNGEKYIGEQIESIVNQSYKNWKLIIRDDNSTDATPSIIKNFTTRFPEKIFWVDDDLGNLGSVQNFNQLLKYAAGENYIMFSDQDDVWMPAKIEVTLNEMIDTEKQFSSSMPVLVYTNFLYANENLIPIQSKNNFSATKVKKLNFNHLLAQSPVYGCTVMFNHDLLKLINDIPNVAENHDYWIALVASAFGKISYLKQPTVLYRQHNKNISTNYDSSSFKKRFKRLKSKKNIDDVRLKKMMAEKFKEVYGKYLNVVQKKIISDFLNLYEHKNISLFLKNIKNGVRRQTFAQTVVFYISVLFYKD